MRNDLDVTMQYFSLGSIIFFMRGIPAYHDILRVKKNCCVPWINSFVRAKQKPIHELFLQQNLTQRVIQCGVLIAQPTFRQATIYMRRRMYIVACRTMHNNACEVGRHLRICLWALLRFSVLKQLLGTWVEHSQHYCQR
jgi:hypothetical protein